MNTLPIMDLHGIYITIVPDYQPLAISIFLPPHNSERWYKMAFVLLRYSNIVTISVLPPVTVANAGPNQTVCATTSITLAGNLPLSGTGTWTLISGPNAGSFSNATAHNSVVTGLVPGTYQFRWTISNIICPSSFDDVLVHISPDLINTITHNTYTICEGQSVTVLATSATGGAGNYQYQWQQSADGMNWTDIIGATGVTYSFTPSSSVILLRRMVNDSPCSKLSNAVTVTMQAAISNNSLPATLAICNDSVTHIIGSLPTGGDGFYTFIWQSSVDGGTTWTTIAGANNKDYTTTALTSAVIYRRIVRTAVCYGIQESISNTTAVTIKYKPTAAFTVHLTLAALLLLLHSRISLLVTM